MKKQTEQQAGSKRRRGRPREFSGDDALHAAMVLFWKRGYEGTSVAELADVMGISKPSLYAAFGDKESLFRKAVLLYTNASADEYAQALELPSAKQVAEAWLRLTSGVHHRPALPSGCFIIQSAVAGHAETAQLRDDLLAIRNRGVEKLKRRMQRASDENDLPPYLDPELMTQYLASLATGLAVQSAAGISSVELNKIVDLVMQTWPAGGKAGDSGS